MATTSKTRRRRTRRPATPPPSPPADQQLKELLAEGAALAEEHAEVETTPIEAPPVPAVQAEKKQPPATKPEKRARDEFEITVPRRPYKKYAPGEKQEMVTKRFFKPKAGRWVVSASTRNARFWHVVDLDRVDTTKQTLCTLNLETWVGRRDEDPKKIPITCEWCLKRMIICKGVTEQANDQRSAAWAEAKKAAKTPKPKEEAEVEATAETPVDEPTTEPTPDTGDGDDNGDGDEAAPA